ncbi:MAG TPA: hypothetical protein VK894_03785 [Jiangellales bacterium]|nr:hypothetical protein [Jiangellales bacterium]
MRTRTLPPYAAYLRVYEPLEAFSAGDQDRWLTYATAEDRPDRREVLAREQLAALTRAVATPPQVAPREDSGDAYVVREPDGWYLCPVQDRLRSWLAVADFRAGLPEPVADAVLPPAVTDEADADFAVWQAQHPAGVPRILTATWHVPVRWFVAFDAGERVLVLGAGLRSLVYRTRIVEARRRVARALRVLRRAVEDGSMTAAVEDLGRWLEEWHPRALVELDYGGLVHLVDDDGLRADESSADVAAAMAALADGDTAAAARAYRRLADRWEAVQALERSC